MNRREFMTMALAGLFVFVFGKTDSPVPQRTLKHISPAASPTPSMSPSASLSGYSSWGNSKGFAESEDSGLSWTGWTEEIII